MPARTDRFDRRVIQVIVAGLAVGWTGCGRTATPDLIAQTRSADGAERSRAVKALGERPKDADRVVPVLVELLKDPDAFVRRDAAQALGRLGPRAEPAVAALRAASQDRNAHVRRAVADAIQKVDPGANVRTGKP
jgi:HEAT repeat protein